jgi:endonuclease-3
MDLLPATLPTFDIDEVMRRLAVAVQPFPPAALFGLAEEGYSTPFEQLLACMISIRTYDEVTIRCARRLFAAARTPAQLLALTTAEIDRLISPCTFHEPKAQQMAELAAIVQERYGGELPCDFAVLTGFHGVGPKCANLVLGIACHVPAISVDVHVHRVTNRWGYVSTRTPEQTMAALEQVLPRAHWIDINRLLVPFGKHICTGTRPHCSTCPLQEMCAQVGVVNPR